MALNNFFFIPFLLVVLLIYWLSTLIFKNSKYKKEILYIELIVASYGFIGCTNIYYALILLIVSLITNFSALGIEKYESRRGLISKLSITILLLILGIFKYYNFFVDSLKWLIGNGATIKILLPLGISFYVFSAISYIIDVYRKKSSVNKSVIEVLFFIGFFPKLLAGPIVRADIFFKQLFNINTLKWSNLEIGVQLFVIGLFKKMVLADRIGVFVDDIFRTPVSFDGLTLLWGVISYSMQIYFDFSGYSDMAIGVSKMFGFDFPDNFNYPYISKNVTEFWKRWHISLSSWLQEYLYYSLGGNRKGKFRTYVNLFLTMLLGGLWHGAAWTFVVWGAMHGFALIVHKLFMIWKETKFGDKKATNFAWNIISVVLTYVFVSFCWIFFRATSFNNAAEVLKGIFTMQIGIVQPYTWSMFGLVWLVIMSFARNKISQNNNCYCGVPIQDLTTIKGQTIFFVLCGLTIILAYVGNTAFIYGSF